MSSKSDDRTTRYTSHALVEFKKNKILPFGIHSGVLLDLSLGGLKMEFTGESQAKEGKSYWITIPLSPLGIKAPKKFTAKIQCRWFDGDKFRLGGSFLGLQEVDLHILQQIINKLNERGLANL